MPRVKDINNYSKLKEIGEQMIEKNDCTSAEIIFKEPFNDVESAILRTAFHLKVESGTTEIKIPKFNNSWKGLLFFLLSILHLKYGKKIFIQTASISGGSLFASEDYNDAYNCKDYFSKDIEILPEMPGYNRCYVVCRTNSTQMNIALKGLIQILQIDEKKSKITIEELQTEKHQYTSRVVDFPPFKPTPRIVKFPDDFLLSAEKSRELNEVHYSLQKKEHERRLLEYLKDTKL